MADIGGRHLSVSVDFARGISIHGIRDQFTGHQFLNPLQPASLFAFASNNGPLRQSMADLEVTGANYTPTSELSLTARGLQEPLLFNVRLTCGNDDVAVISQVAIQNIGPDDSFLRLVMPVIEGLTTPGSVGGRRFVVPQELGAVIADDDGPVIGMELFLPVGLPLAMNSMEVACFYDVAGAGGVFFADIDGNPEEGVSPLQLTAFPNAAFGYWIATIPPGGTINVPRLAIGVHHRGDWHDAVDFYTAHHRPRWRFIESPEWFRNQGAIYTFAGGGAGGILMSEPRGLLGDGAIWATWEVNDGPWQDGEAVDRYPIPVSTAGLAPAGAPLAAIRRHDEQIDVFVVGHDGAIWVAWETDDGRWRNGSYGRYPVRISPPCFALPGSPIAAAHQTQDQLDVFVVGHDGAIWVTCERGGGAWQDGFAGRLPWRITPPGFAPLKAHVVAARQNDHQLDVFVVGHDGAIWVTWAIDGGPWRDGLDGRMPARVTPAGFAPPGAPLAAAKQNDGQLDVFVVRDGGAIWATFEVNDGPWTDGNDGRHPLAVSPPSFAPLRAPLAAAKQNDDQLDVFVVRDDGAIWATFEVSDGPWTDGNDGRHPVRISTTGLALPLAWLSAVFQNETQFDVLVVGKSDTIWLTCQAGNGPWTDGRFGRPEPVRVTLENHTPAGGGVATVLRSTGRVDAFTVGKGSIGSFRELPRLLEEARSLGTDVVYLYDYWEGVDGFPAYWNKGDYFFRSDLGGESAFIDGVRALHDQGGRIIVYVEPFIIFKHSEIGRALGEAWAGRWPDGNLHEQYADNFTMVATFGPWLEYIIAVCQRLVCHCGVDGIFLDSYGWTMNWPMKTAAEGRLYLPHEHARGVLQLTDRVRDAIRRTKPDAVVLGETSSGPIGRHWDGGLSADFATWPPWKSREIMRGRLRGSPVRYAVPEVKYFGNGIHLSELHQVFAAGHGLALCYARPGSFMFVHAAHIKKLVELRKKYRNALIDGAQEYQPAPDNDAVTAYFYRGLADQLLTVVNTSQEMVTTSIRLRQTETNAVWLDLLNEEAVTELTTVDTLLQNVMLEPRESENGIRVFLRTRFGRCWRANRHAGIDRG